MKILYSQIKTLLPKLTTTPQKVGQALTLTGLMMDGFQEIIYQGKKDYLLSFETRQNRADCLSVIGLCREIAAYFGLKIDLPKPDKIKYGSQKIDVKIEAPQYVKKVLALEFADLQNGESPAWLKEFLSFYDINSINFLVDISNYVMIFTGYPSHLLDRKKIQGVISWAVNNSFDEIITLDNTKISLPKKEELLVRDEKNPLALAGMVGGQAAAISSQTKNIVAETAVYDRALIRRNSRALKITTEASIRLEKDLDPNGSDYAMALLASMILQYGGGKITSRLFTYYPQKRVSPKIKFNLQSPSIFAGVEIKEARIKEILKNLRFKFFQSGKHLIVEPPTDRMDIEIKEDIVEEIVRIFGYDKIPADQFPKFEVVKNITPRIIYLEEKIRDIISALGYDEILSWPLTDAKTNKAINWRSWSQISTQNAINEESPELRQSVASGLLLQLEKYEKKNVEFANIFEIGKIFGKKERYKEIESLGILLKKRDGETINSLKKTVEILLGSLGLGEIYYQKTKNAPKISNQNSCWDILCKEKLLGIIYKLRPLKNFKAVYFSELDLEELERLLGINNFESVVELNQKIVVLDANVELEKSESIDEYLKKIKEKIGKDKIWSLVISDIFSLEERIRYTVRVSYKELTDQEAKKIHLDAFSLI